MVSDKILSQTPIQKINHGSPIDDQWKALYQEYRKSLSTFNTFRTPENHVKLVAAKKRQANFVKNVHTKDIRETNWSYSVYLIRNHSFVYLKVQKEKQYKTLDIRLVWTLQKHCDQQNWLWRPLTRTIRTSNISRTWLFIYTWWN